MGDLEKNGSPVKSFLFDIIRGFVIGIAFIIPGFSGGSIAAIVGIYERLINAVADIFTDFKNSVKTLLPVGLGMVLGAVSLLFPLGWALEAFPLPTISLFVGLAIGGMPSITDKVKGGRVKFTNVLACLIPFLLALLLSFMPIGANLLDISFGGYALLFLVGILGSAALVIPGISGSMLLLILGYYNPIVNILTKHLLVGRDVLKSVLVLGSTALGIAVGFVLISVIMKMLFKKCPRGTYFAIIGFVLGSIPTIFISTAKEAGITLTTLPTSPFHWIACVILLILGFSGSFALVLYAKRSSKPKESAEKPKNS